MENLGESHASMHDESDKSLPDDLLVAARQAVGATLRAHREGRGLSQAAVSAYAGVHQSEWSRLESGEVDPRLSWLLRAQHLFELESLEGLFGLLPTRRLLTNRGKSEPDG
jgi:transcriptional regulator with XRE-family HTH domain